MPTFYKAPEANFWSTTLNGDINDAVETVTLTSVTNLQAPGCIVIDREDGAGTATPPSREVITFTGISGTDLTGCTRGAMNSTARAHTDGALVEAVFGVDYWNYLVDGILEEHNQDGTHNTTKVVDLDTAQTLTNKTLTSPQINDTTADHQYVVAVSELTADRTVTLPLLTGNDEFVFKDHTQTLTKKTLTSPVINTPKINEDVALTSSSTELNLLDGITEVADVSNRQGGDATDWSTSGTTDYSESDVIIQSGCVAITIASGSDYGTSAEVTFPIAFAGTPLAFGTVDDTGSFSTFNETPFIVLNANYPTATKLRFTALTRSGNVAANRTFGIHWLAIGKKAA